MLDKARIEKAVERAVHQRLDPACPPGLADAMAYALFPGGARIRPRLCLSVALACGDDAPDLADGAAAAIELLHCASLIHDDLPCFDDADIRRGKPSVHKKYGEPLAVLAGDALIVTAFQAPVQAAVVHPARLGPIVDIIGAAVSVPNGIVAGQAWECEPKVNLSDYQQAKTGALFAAATMAGAAAAGMAHEPWRMIGERIGEAFQVADDLRDAVSTAEELGKPVGQDETHNRPSAVRALGIEGAVSHLKGLVFDAVHAVPDCPGQGELQAMIVAESKKFLPKPLAVAAE